MSMMQVLNSKERNQAFLKFLIFFVVTMALVVAALFFNMRLPLKENRKLQERLTIQGEREMKQDLFAKNMNQALQLLDSIDKNPMNKDRLEIELNGKVTNLSSLQLKDESVYAKMNDAIIKSILELKQGKLQLMKLSDRASALAEIEQKLRICQGDLEQRTRDLALLQQGR